MVSQIEIVWEVIKEEEKEEFEEVWHKLGELLAQEGAEVVWTVLEAVFEADSDIREVILEKLGCKKEGEGDFMFDDW